MIGCAPLITMMKPSHFGNLDDRALTVSLHFSGFWGILVKSGDDSGNRDNTR
jgi:hypothetical protein